MHQYTIKIDKKIIAILGPHLYGDTASIIAELISNSYDADADDCWVTIKTGTSPEIIIEDNGEGMVPDEVDDNFLDIGYNRRDKRPTTKKRRKVFGRKGIGKLAAFSLAKKIKLYSVKGETKAGCILDYDKITLEDKEPETIPDEEIVFDPKKLSKEGSGTRLELSDIKKNINNTYYYLVNRIMRNFAVNFDEFKIHLIKNDASPKTVKYTDLDFFSKMDTIITIGDELKDRIDEVVKNDIEKNYKITNTYENLISSVKDKKARYMKLPKNIKVLSKSGEIVDVEFTIKGWVGTVLSKDNLTGLIYSEGSTEDEVSNISLNDNRITIFSRDRIGEYDVLPKVQTTTVYDAYIIGEIHMDLFEDDQLVDMAISNRRGYEETDERYQTLIDCLRPIVSYIAQRKAEVAHRRKTDENLKESEDIKKGFLEKERTRKILMEKLDEVELEIVQDDHFQFSRATRLSENTKRIFISHNKEHEKYGFFIMRLFELLKVDIEKNVIFTSYAPTGVPHDQNIYDYLKSCFREDIYVIFLFSRHFYDSNVCVAETGAAWATNRNHSNVIIDIGYEDIDKPIDNAKQGFRIGSLDSLDREEVLKFLKTALSDCGFDIPTDDKIHAIIEKAILEFQDALNVGLFYPRRKYQGHPVCSNPKCGNAMELEYDGADLYYVCRTPGCGRKIKAEIY